MSTHGAGLERVERARQFLIGALVLLSREGVDNPEEFLISDEVLATYSPRDLTLRIRAVYADPATFVAFERITAGVA